MRILESSIDLGRGDSDPLVVKRVYEAPPTRIFRAWVDPRDLAIWYTPNPDWPAKISAIDFRVHGGFTAAFGEPRQSPWIERVQFLAIDPPRRIEFLGYMTRDAAFVSCTRVVIELSAHGASACALTMTEHGCDAAQRADRAGGWGGTLDNLARLDA